MNDEFTNPFVPGARVAVSNFHGDNYREEFVGKVFKSGNFTLRGSTQQWRPSSWKSLDGNRVTWCARETGERMRFSRRNLKIWDSETDAEIAEARASAARQHKRRELRDRLAAVPNEKLTDDMLAQIEAALSPASKP